MTETETPPVAEAPPKKHWRDMEATREKKRKVGYKLKMALLDVIERKRLTDRVDYMSISKRHGISKDSIKRTYYQWSAGKVDMGEPASQQEKQIDARLLHERTLELCRRYKALLLNGFEGMLYQAEDALTNGKPLGWKDTGLPYVIRELKEITGIQQMHERGYASILEDMLAQSARQNEKLLPGRVMDIPTETKILHANDEEKALAALNGDLGHHVSEQASTALSE